VPLDETEARLSNITGKPIHLSEQAVATSGPTEAPITTKTTCNDKEESAMSTEQNKMLVRDHRESTVQEHIDAENRNEPVATAATFSSSSARYDIPAFGDAGQVPDHAAVRAMFEGIFAVFPDFHLEPGPLRHGDNHVPVEIRMSGTQKDDWAGIPNQGRSLDTRIACIYEFDDKELVCERVYLDFGEIARQLGAV
jgi:predicted ester cyclase